MCSENMKRKVATTSALRLSPNEEASILQQERERRRKLRLQQVREQEKFIAQQIRQDVKERRDQQLQQVAEDLRAKWEAAQAEKLQALEKIYLSTLSAIGEGHRQAKENEPDLKASKKAVAVNNEKAEKRHREALKDLKQHKEKQHQAQTWHIKARKKALDIEKERAAKIASLPPPPPDPLQNIEVAKRLPLVNVCNVNSFSSSHYHLPEAYVDREMDTEQTDARSAAVEEEKRLIALQQEEERDRREQMEKASLRGSHALKMVQLAQDRERLMKELEQMQQDDLSRRRQIVAKMPQQLFEPAYRRAEVRAEWQRDLETAFEDMYTRSAKMRGDLVLHLKPQPLPDPSVTSVDEDLDLTVEPEVVSGTEQHSGGHEDVSSVEEPQEEAKEPQSKKVLKRLLNRIRTQKDQWHAKADTADTISDTLESGSLPTERESGEVIQEEGKKSEIDFNEVTDNTVLAGKSILLHPQEQAMRIRMEAEKKKKMEDLEQQKREQLELINKLEEQRRSLEAEFHKVRLQAQEVDQESSATEQKEKPVPAVVDEKPAESAVTAAQLNTSAESLHIQIIREYQQRLIEQNRVHQQSVEEARKRLQEYQLLLKNRYPHLSTSSVGSPNKGQENTRSLQQSQSDYSENNRRAIPSSLPGQSALVSSPGRSLSTEKLKSSQSMSQDPAKTQQRSLRSGMSLQQNFDSIPSSVSDFLATDSYEPTTQSPVSVDSSQQTFLGGRSPKGLFSHSPTEDRVRSQDILLGSEKLSSTSSPGDPDSSSATSYLPLPLALSLDLPQVEFSEPSISFTLPEAKREPLPLGDFSSVQEFRERLLSSAAEIRNQQDHLKEMQIHLDQQRESLLSNQKSHEQHLLNKQKELEEQMLRHQESLEKLLGSTEPEQGAVGADLHMIPERERYRFMSALLKAMEDDAEDISTITNFSPHNHSLMRPPGRDQKWRPSKPPVTKTKLGPFLQQHELSAILEVETPSASFRRSSTGVPELKENQPGQDAGSGFGEPVGAHPDISKMSTDSTIIPADLSGLLVSIGDETPNQNHVKLSWRDTLSLDGSHDPTRRDHSFTPGSHQSPYEIPTGHRHSFPKPLSMVEGASGPGSTGQGRSPNSVCDLSSTTISSGSFLTSEKTDSSPGNTDLLSDLQRCNYSAIEVNNDSVSSPSAATTGIPPATTWSDYLSSVGNRSQIQQIIEKYTKDLSASLERNLSFHSPEVPADISAADNHLSTTFHSLDPKPDFSVSTLSYAHSEDRSSPQSMPDLGQSSRSGRNHSASQLPYNTPTLGSSVGLFHSQNMGRSSPRRHHEADSSGSFLPLHPESTLNEPNISGHEEPSYLVSSQEQEDPLQRDVSQSVAVSRKPYVSHRPFASQHLSNILMSAAEESRSFHELVAAQATLEESELSEHPISESLERNSVRSVRFEELPTAQADQGAEASTYRRDPQHSDEGSNQADQTPRSENMTRSSHSRSSLQSLSSLTTGSSAGFLSSVIRTWDSDSIRGILEEPDLTLLSLNDSSVVCSEPLATPRTVSDQDDGNTPQSSFHHLQPEVDASGLQVSDRASLGMSLSQHFAEMSLEYTSTPASLQEALLRKKRGFIESSSKRVQEMKKSREPKPESQSSNLTNVSATHEDERSSSEAVPHDGGRLKKVVEVKVCTPEDRRLSEIEMHQRTIRLYNQLDEVKLRRDDKMRQESYAKNREKAKEFKKRTLEKLRAKR
ncbi:centrosomal protein of 295 kDa [Eleutherodactylus coqui]|uniref:centrosomal protein of 295 kDa n=1 Tax=Eleutherodactylus coqui TaxID=57060 RepID=UPI003463524A